MQLLAATRGLGVILLSSTCVSFLPEQESPSGAAVKQTAAVERNDASDASSSTRSLNSMTEEPAAAAQIQLAEVPPAVKAASKTKDQVKAKVFLSVDKLPAGGKCKFLVILDVEKGWHINANPPEPDNMIPTQVTVASKVDLKQAETKYPTGKKLVVEVFPEPVSVYEGEVEIRGEIDVPAAAGGKTDDLEFQIRYQACNDKTCLPPKTLKLANKMEVAKSGTSVKQINQKYFPSK
ncbi:MAG: protein-disulfide reductase DsbD family protein [Planctomycetaceae bacterium]